jgi:hypothetical protein
MSHTYRQTISDELAEKVEETRAALGLSVQELTTMALALFCRDQQHKPACASPPAPETYVLSFD